MMSAIYPFSIGAIRAWALSDAEAEVIPLEQVRAFWGHIPEAATDPIFESYPPEYYGFSYNCLLLELGDQRILIDTGNGVNPQRPEAGHLVGHLASLGLGTDAIAMVIFSHLHGDHLNGALDAAGELVFPKARYVMNRAEYDFWAGEDYPSRYPPEAKIQMHQKLARLKPSLTLLDPGTEVAPGLQLLAAYGHTPGHSLLRIESQGQVLHHLVDSLHTVAQVARPHWSPPFDVDPLQAAQTRTKLLKQAQEEEWWVLFYHLPFPGLGQIVNTQGEVRWKPWAN